MKVNRYYICDNCDHSFVVKQEMNENLKKRCPNCKKHKLYQDLTGQHVNVIGEPTSLQQLADRNTKEMGKYQLETEREKQAKQRYGAKLQMLKEQGMVSHDATEIPTAPKTWYNAEGKNLAKSLDHLDTPEKQKKYIMEGDSG